MVELTPAVGQPRSVVIRLRSVTIAVQGRKSGAPDADRVHRVPTPSTWARLSWIWKLRRIAIIRGGGSVESAYRVRPR